MTPGETTAILEEVWHIPQHTGCNFSLLTAPVVTAPAVVASPAVVTGPVFAPSALVLPAPVLTSPAPEQARLSPANTTIEILPRIFHGTPAPPVRQRHRRGQATTVAVTTIAVAGAHDRRAHTASPGERI